MSINIDALNAAWKEGRIKIPRDNAFLDMLRTPWPEEGPVNFGGDDPIDHQGYSIRYAIDWAKFRVTKDELVRHQLLRVVDYEEGKSGLYHFGCPPRVDPSNRDFVREAIERGWLRRGLDRLESTGLGRCIAVLHKNWRGS